MDVDSEAEDDEVVQLQSDASNMECNAIDSVAPQHLFSSPITNIGIYGTRHLFPAGLTTLLACKCGEKDAEIMSLEAEHDQVITALSKEHTSRISTLKEASHRRAAEREYEYDEERKAASLELEDRLTSLFTYLDVRDRVMEDTQREASKKLQAAQKQLEQDRSQLTRYSTSLAVREHDLQSAQLSFTAAVQERQVELQLSHTRFWKIQHALSLVNEYVRDCTISSELASLALQKQTNLDAARSEATTIISNAKREAERILLEAKRDAAARALQTQWEAMNSPPPPPRSSSPTHSDGSADSSVYSLRSFDSLPILPEGEEPWQEDDMRRTRTTSLDGHEMMDGTLSMRPSGTRRKPIPMFPTSAAPNDFGLKPPETSVEFPVVPKGVRRTRTRTSPNSSLLPGILPPTAPPRRKRTVSRDQPDINGTHTPKPFRPYPLAQ